MISRFAVTALYSFLNLSENPLAGKILFLNGTYAADLEGLDVDVIQNVFQSARFFKALTSHPTDIYRNIWILGSKQKNETRGFIGRALLCAAPDAHITIALENDMGGRTIGRDLKALGLNFSEEGRAHSRLYHINLSDQIFDKNLAQAWCQYGEFQSILDGSYLSCVGLYGWDQVDEGSQLLLNTIDQSLSGEVADFGCGYGYLSCEVLKAHQNIKAITFADCDARAVEATSRNLQHYNIEKKPIWCDLTSHMFPYQIDHIVMNPPFHKGQTSSIALGRGFIKTAAQSLKAGGSLWVVANRHLPYEEQLKEYFKSHVLKADQKGFKVYEAIK